jgi:WXG100 family type VII secretion target
MRVTTREPKDLRPGFRLGGVCRAAVWAAHAVPGVVGTRKLEGRHTVMAQANISVLEGALLKGADAVQDAKGRTDSELKAIFSLVEEIRGFWTGPAALAYTNLQTEFNRHATALNNTLIGLEENLRRTDTQQKQREEDNLTLNSGLLGRLQG